MKLFFSILIFSSVTFAMHQDPKNLSREKLEEEYSKAQRVITEQKMMIDALLALPNATPFEQSVILMGAKLHTYAQSSKIFQGNIKE